MNQKETKSASKQRQQKTLQQPQTDIDENQFDSELSTTLVERRKRLHILANEINNWEDEPITHKK